MPAGFATAAVQAAIAVVKQCRKGEISKIEAILDIQAALTSEKDEPSNEELVSEEFWPFANPHYGDWPLTWDNSQHTPKTPDEAIFLQEQIDREVQLFL